jgi:peroxiredoxin family protein
MKGSNNYDKLVQKEEKMRNEVILVSSNMLGRGNDELGETILETFFTVLEQKGDVPHAVFCMNSSVLTMTKQSLVSVHLKELEQRGTRIIACKTCADHYEVTEQLTVSEIRSMNDFVELAAAYEVLTIS